MHNYLTNSFPETVKVDGKEFSISCDFKSVVKIVCLEEDDAFNRQEKIVNELKIFYGLSIPGNIDDAYKEMWKFISGHDNSVNTSTEINRKIFDFEIDSGLIYEAFFNQYHIDLLNTEMHWFKFMCLLQNINNDHVKLNEVIFCRGVVINNDMSDSQRKYYRQMKEKYALEGEYSDFIDGSEVCSCEYKG